MSREAVENVVHSQEIEIFVRVKGSEVLNLVGTVSAPVISEPITDETRRTTDASEATGRLTLDLPGVFRTLLAEFESGR